MLGRKKLCSGLINIHYVKDGIHSCHVLKSEILVVKNHPLITMLLRHMLYVGEHTYWYDNLTTIGEHDTELATHIEIKPLDSNVYRRYLEVIDYQLFAFNTVEKWIGSYLWVYGK